MSQTSSCLSYDAMTFALERHKDQVRKYTGAYYFEHLSEVAGIIAAAAPLILEEPQNMYVDIQQLIAVAFLHDAREDQGVTFAELQARFGTLVAQGVDWLSDMEPKFDETTKQGFNRETRKKMSRDRLSKAPGWVQSVKCGDLYSNTKSIMKFDPSFGVQYLDEKRELVKVLTKAHPKMLELACLHL